MTHRSCATSHPPTASNPVLRFCWHAAVVGALACHWQSPALAADRGHTGPGVESGSMSVANGHDDKNAFFGHPGTVDPRGTMSAKTRLTVHVRGPGKVKVVDAGDGSLLGSCDSEKCSFTFRRDQKLRLRAVPKIGGTFSGWQTPCRDAPQFGCDVAMSSNVDSYVEFNKAELLLPERDRDLIGDARVISAEEAERIFENHEVFTIGPDKLAALDAKRVAELKRADWHIANWVKRHPEGREWAYRTVRTEDGRTPTGGVGASIDISASTRDGSTAPGRSFQLMDNDFRKIEVASAIEFAGNPVAYRHSYEGIYKNLPAELIRSAGLTQPARVAASQVSVRRELRKIADAVDEFLLGQAVDSPPGKPASCEDEIGYPGYMTAAGPNLGDGATESTYDCNVPKNSLSTKFDYPLKPYLTCVKDQDNRGTCGAFATMGAFETLYAVNTGKWMNLSEQQFYYSAKTTWSFGLFGDGLHLRNYLTDGLPNGQTVRLETAWPYNPSHYRSTDEAAKKYASSCLQYEFTPEVGLDDNYCSNTSGQGVKYCVSLPGMQEQCFYYGAADDLGGFGPQSGVLIADPDDVDSSIAALKAAIAGKMGVVIAIEIWKGFGSTHNPGPFSGFVDMPAENEDPRGVHVMQVVGYVGAATVKNLLGSTLDPNETGYIILRNSWSGCWGDNGFGYLPISYLKKYGFSALAFSGAK